MEPRDELIRTAATQFERLSRRMLRRVTVAEPWADESDVIANALMRLLRHLEAVEAADSRSFLNAASSLIGRSLTDVARHFQRASECGHDGTRPAGDPNELTVELGRWVALYAAAEDLPAELRETFGLRFYHHWTEARIAELLEISAATARGRWVATCQALSAALSGRMPDAG